MEIFKKSDYDNYVFWLGDNVNKNLNIPTKYDIAIKIYNKLDSDIKKYVENKGKLTEVSQIFLDSLTGNMKHLISLLRKELKVKSELFPYSYLSQIDVISTIITHDHSNIIENIWENGDVHDVFEDKQLMKSNVNLFKILGDHNNSERIILTSQNMRKIDSLSLYDHFWKKLNNELNCKNLVLMGVNLDDNTMELLTLVFSKIKNTNHNRYFVTSKDISEDEEAWLLSNSFKLIQGDDQSFIEKMLLYFNNKKIENEKIGTTEDTLPKVDNNSIDDIAIDKTNNHGNNIQNINKSEITDETVSKFQLKLSKMEGNKNPIKIKKIVSDIQNSVENSENIADSNINLDGLNIRMKLEDKTLVCSILDNEKIYTSKRLSEFRKKQYPSYKIDDFYEINHYKALDIKIPFSYSDIPDLKLERKIYNGKVDIRCNDQTIYNVIMKTHTTKKYKIVEFKNHDFSLKFLLKDEQVIRFAYKISENTNNIKGLRIYIFFKNLFNGFELNFKNKKISGDYKIPLEMEEEKLDKIIDVINKYLCIKKKKKIRDVTLNELLQNSKNLEILYSYYNKVPMIINGNITIRSLFLENINHIEKLVLNLPININFLGLKKSFLKSIEIKLQQPNITQIEDKLEIQIFNASQKITYNKYN